MAKDQSHISFSLVIAVTYSAFGFFLLDVHPEPIILAAAIIVIAGILPNIDAGPDAPLELGGMLSAVVPIAVLEFFPIIKTGGITRVALVVICCYLLARILIVRLLFSFTEHRGIMHSIPAALLTGEFVYFLFWDLPQTERLFLACAGLLGFMSHLALDGMGNLQLIGGAGKKSNPSPTMKFTGNSWASTIVIYFFVGYLGWLIFQDFYVFT